MLVFKNTLDRSQYEVFRQLCESLDIQLGAKTGKRFYYEHRTTQNGVNVTRATAFCDAEAFEALVNAFPRNGKVYN